MPLMTFLLHNILIVIQSCIDLFSNSIHSDLPTSLLLRVLVIIEGVAVTM